MPTLKDSPISALPLIEQGSAPATPATGTQKLFIDSADHLLYLVDENDAVTAVGGGGGGLPFYGQATITAPPAVSGFTWVNQGAATVNEASSTIYMTIASDGSAAAHFLKKSKTGTYTITALMGYSVNDSGTQQYGFVWRESGSGSIIYFGPAYDAGMRLAVIKYTNTAGAGASYYKSTTLPVYNNPLWLRIQVDGSNRICYYSQDGLTWITWHSVSKTDFMTADEVGYGLCSQTTSSTPYGGTLFSWTEA